MSTSQRFVRIVAVAAFAATIPGLALARCPFHQKKVRVNGVIGTSFKFLGSPSGYAGNNGQGYTIEVLDNGVLADFVDEVWIQEPGFEVAPPGPVNLFDGGPQDLDCDDDEVPEYTYLEHPFNGGTFFPTFGGNGSLGIAVKCDNGSVTGGASILARSTDIEGDADTDEDDENALRAAFCSSCTASQLKFDLDFDNDVDATDLGIVVAEAWRRVYPAYGNSSWQDTDCHLSGQIPMPTNGVAMYPPAAITNLAGLADQNAIKLTWTAHGDDGSTGQAASYDIRYSTTPITNFDTATPAGSFAPGPAGTSECFIVNNLDACTDYYFAIKTIDDVGNSSAISNVLLKKTRCFGFLDPPPNCDPQKAGAERAYQSVVLNATGPAVVGTEPAAFRLAIPVELEGAPIRVAIFDVRGRSIRDLVDGVAHAGELALTWDLRRSGGGTVPSGVYYLSARVGDRSVRRHIVVTR